METLALIVLINLGVNALILLLGMVYGVVSLLNYLFK
jgi:hypothetical protein